MDVGVRELKQRLSEFLERVARGEVFRVTDRGKPKAILAPVPGQTQLREGVARKWIVAGTDEAPRRVRRHKSAASVSSVLREDRDR